MYNPDINNVKENICKHKVKKCLKCGALTHENDNKEFFCSQCGAPVLNKCSNYDCQEILDEKAKFCKYCGSASIFKNYGLLDIIAPAPWNNSDDLPF